MALGIAHVPEGRRVFPDLTVEENLRTGAFLRSDKAEIDKDLDEVFQHFPRLKERRKQWARSLSGGEQQMLAIGRALMSRPKMLVLDEPSMGLSPVMVQEIARIVRDIVAPRRAGGAGRAERRACAQARALRLCARDRKHRAARPGARAARQRACQAGLSRWLRPGASKSCSAPAGARPISPGKRRRSGRPTRLRSKDHARAKDEAGEALRLARAEFETDRSSPRHQPRQLRPVPASVRR